MSLSIHDQKCAWLPRGNRPLRSMRLFSVSASCSLSFVVQIGSEQVAVVLRSIGIVIAVYPPDFGQFQHRIEFFVERTLRLDVAQEHDDIRLLFAHYTLDMIETAMGVVKKKDVLTIVLQC